MKRVALYLRVSTVDQNLETQVHDLHSLAAQRGFQIVERYEDRISGAKAKRPGLDALLNDARRGRFDIVLVWAFDRIARSVKHFLEVDDHDHGAAQRSGGVNVLAETDELDIELRQFIAELEHSLIVERVRAGMRRARLEGRRIGRAPIEVDRAGIMHDRLHGQSLKEIAKTYRISRAMVSKVIRQERLRHGGVPKPTLQVYENRPPKSAA